MGGAETAVWRGRMGLLLGLLVVSWTVGGGLVSSNDGSHLALSRAQALRRGTQIDPDRDLCLRVDVARRKGHAYSDRPPGTAWLAMPAVWIGAQLDPTLAQWTQENRQIAVQPARRNYARTYVARLRDGPPLISLQGTALLVGWHVRLMGALGLGILLHLLASAGVSPWRRRAVVTALALGSLWGPYSTMLFSHVTASTMMLVVWATLQRHGSHSNDAPMAGWLWPVVGGICGSLAIASDYLLLLAVVPLVALHAPPRSWPLWLLGAAPVALAVALYHHVAFGSAWAVGYDFQQNFAFARQRGATFDRSPLHGLWVLWGAGRGAGLLSQSPVWLLGLVGLVWQRQWRIALAFTPWVVALAMHHTPWGGGTQDYRYLLPALPVLAWSLGVAWQRVDTAMPAATRATALVLFGLAGLSTFQVWTHFLGWRG